MSFYVIRNLKGDEMFKAAAAKAQAEGTTLRRVIIRLVDLYARVGLARLERAAADQGDQP
jgi:hypothetical protein